MLRWLRGCLGGLGKWARRQRRQLQRPHLPGSWWERRGRRGGGGRGGGRMRAAALCSVAAVCAGGAGWWAVAGRGEHISVHDALNSTRHNTTSRPRCPAATPVVECGDLLGPDVLCRAARWSQLAVRFSASRMSPWSEARGRRERDNALRVMQYAWSAPQFGSGNSWEATRVQILAAAVLSRADIVCLQGLEREQAQWLKEALDYQGYSGIISSAAESRPHREAHAPDRSRRGPNAATFWRQKYTLASSLVVDTGPGMQHAGHPPGDPASGVQQGALVLVLNATTTVRGISTPYAIRVANTVVDPSAPPAQQVAALAEVLPRLAASPALPEGVDSQAAAGTASLRPAEATVVSGTLTLPPKSQPLQYLQGGTLPSAPRETDSGRHQLDLDSAYAAVTRQEHYELNAGMHSGAVWYTPGLLQALAVLVPVRNASDAGVDVVADAPGQHAAAWEQEVRLGTAEGGCVPSIVDFAIELDVAARGGSRKRRHRAANPLSKLARVEDGGGLNAEHVLAGDASDAVAQKRANHTRFLRDLSLVRGVCINVDQVHAVHAASLPHRGPAGTERAQDFDGLMHMFKCLQRSVSGSKSQAELAQASVAMGKAASTAERLEALADFAARHSFQRQQTRECAQAWRAPVVPELQELVKLLQQHKQKVFLKSDGLADFTHRVAKALNVPDRYVVANSWTFSPHNGLITGVMGPGGLAANSAAAVVAKVREHKQALKQSAYLIVGGAPADYAARRSSPLGADMLITLNLTRALRHDASRGHPQHPQLQRTDAPVLPDALARESPPPGAQGADWNAHNLADVILAFKLAHMVAGGGADVRVRTLVCECLIGPACGMQWFQVAASPLVTTCLLSFPRARLCLWLHACACARALPWVIYYDV